MKIVSVKLHDLKPYENNPRLNDNAVDSVMNSIKEFGFKVPIVITKDNVIVAGHTRYKASKKLNLDEVPCIVADDLSEQQIKAFRLADNKVSELAEWDFSKLEMELAEIELDMSLFSFEELEIKTEDNVSEEDNFNIDEALEEISTPTTQKGQLWKLGNHYLMCGDSTNKNDVEKLMQGNKADLFLSDPPYNVNYQGKSKERMTILNDDMDSVSFRSFLTDAFKNAFNSMKDGASFYIWYASKEHINFELAINNNEQEVKQVLIWNKNNIVLGRQDYHWKHEPCLYGWKKGAGHNWYSDRKQTTVLDFDKPSKSDLHPTMKPVDLISYQIKNSSQKNNIVLDLFGGSGTTLIACEQLNRICYTMELDEKYCDVIINRWETLTGKKAELIF